MQDRTAGLGDKPERNLDLWRRWKAGEPRADLARSSGISAERVRQIVQKIERANRAG